MILALDSFYVDGQAKTVCLQFNNWTDTEPQHVISEIMPSAEIYEPGMFYKKELPCILSILQQVDLAQVTTIVIDGFVLLDENGKPGLGVYLFKELKQKITVIGVAKNDFKSLITNKRLVYRGQSKNPLYITALGVDIDEAANNIRQMHGPYRIPHLLKQLDVMTKQ